jgi:glucose uptake protein GlcU
MKPILKQIFIPILFIVFTAVTVNNPAPGFFTTSICGGGSCTFKNILNTIIPIILGFSGLIAMVYIIVGGYQIATAAGNEETVKNGRKTLTNAIIGLVIIILSYVIVTIVVNGAFGNFGTS